MTLKELRKRRGLTQTQLADIIGTTQFQISELERAQGNIRISRLVQLCDALDARAVVENGFGLDFQIIVK